MATFGHGSIEHHRHIHRLHNMVQISTDPVLVVMGRPLNLPKNDPIVLQKYATYAENRFFNHFQQFTDVKIFNVHPLVPASRPKDC